MWIRTTLKWLGFAALGLAGLAMVAVLVIYLAIEQDLGRTFAIEGESVAVPMDAVSIEEGQRQAQLRGCSGGCHGRTTEGLVFVELFDGTRVVAPDLARIAARYSTVELERAIRHGVKPDGTSVLRVMPSEMLAGLSDQHLGMIIAYLRSQAEGKEALPKSRYGPVARFMGMLFKREMGTLLAAEVIDHEHPTPIGPPDEADFGRYLAQTVCTECHGSDLRGAPDGTIPGLAMTLAYSREDFERLMREGKPLGERELGMMAGVARSRFVRFTDEELTALHAYLHSAATWSD
jgi:cytochrome c553